MNTTITIVAGVLGGVMILAGYLLIGWATTEMIGYWGAVLVW